MSASPTSWQQADDLVMTLTWTPSTSTRRACASLSVGHKRSSRCRMRRFHTEFVSQADYLMV